MAVKFVDINYKNIFKNINLEIRKDEIVSVVGKTGSGKTSFFNLIYGIDINFTGKIIINKKHLTSKTKRKDLQIIRKDMFYLIQEYQNQLFNIDILEDIRYGVSILNDNKLDELFKMFNLDKKILKKNYHELSSGEIKKILIITMLIKDSKIILLDDPTSNLDQKSIGTLIKLLKKEKRNGKTIIITSQDSEFLLSISDRILMIENGNITNIDNKYDFFTNQQLLNECNLLMPNVLNFRENVLRKKGIKLMCRDNINDLIKDIYRSAK